LTVPYLELNSLFGIILRCDIRQHSRPALKSLQGGIYIDKIEPRDFGLRLHSEIGKSFPLHCTAMGKVHLA